MKKWISLGLAVIAVVAIGFAVRFFVTTSALIDRKQNRVVPVALNITPDAQALHATLDVADTHADSLLWKRDLLERQDHGHIDLPRLIEGRFALQVFSSARSAAPVRRRSCRP
jgi:membrane dipeptidase